MLLTFCSRSPRYSDRYDPVDDTRSEKNTNRSFRCNEHKRNTVNKKFHNACVIFISNLQRTLSRYTFRRTNYSRPLCRYEYDLRIRCIFTRVVTQTICIAWSVKKCEKEETRSNEFFREVNYRGTVNRVVKRQNVSLVNYVFRNESYFRLNRSERNTGVKGFIRG